MADEIPVRSRWLPSLLGLFALSSVGFATGFAAGGLWDGPGLVLQQLLGGGQELAWGPDARLQRELARVAEAPVPAAVAAPPTGQALAAGEGSAEGSSPAAAKPGRAEAGRGATPAVSARPPAGGRLSIQVGAFGESGGAEKLVQRLRSAGFPAYVAVGAGEGARWRVRVGPYPTRAKAEEAAGRLKQAEKLPTWVLDEDAGNG